MKKSVKIVLLFLLLIFVGVGVFFALRLYNNKFSDLVCFRDVSNSTIDMKEEAKFIFEFDDKGIIKSYKEERSFTFPTSEEAQEYYAYLLEYSEFESKLDNNKVFSSTEYQIVENEGYYNKTKKQIKKHYEEEFKYLCE